MRAKVPHFLITFVRKEKFSDSYRRPFIGALKSPPHQTERKKVGGVTMM